MKVFIIGNGFDIGHGLKTTYWDFRTFLENVDLDFLQSFENAYNIYPGSNDTSKSELLWGDFEKNLANIDEDTIIGNVCNLDMGLESGDVGIKDTLYQHFSQEYNFFENLPIFLKRWIRSIRIRDLSPKTSLIFKDLDAKYITFNYTNVLEHAYTIPRNRIIHIHGSLKAKDGNPILGHGNFNRIHSIEEKQQEAEIQFDEKLSSICEVLGNHYNGTLKDTSLYIHRLSSLKGSEIEEVSVVGFSFADVDLPYLKEIDNLSVNKALWTIYYFKDSERTIFVDALKKCGISNGRTKLLHSDDFYTF